MALKNIMVHVDSDVRSMRRIALARSIALRYGSRVAGIFGQRARADQVGIVFTWPSKEYTEAVEAALADFRSITADLPDTGWYDINRCSDAEILKQVTNYARFADLLVFGQRNDLDDHVTPPQIAEAVALGSGRPVLVVPDTGDFDDVGRRPLIVWTNSAQSARALNDALPLIQSGAAATLLCLAKTDEEARLSCLEVGRHLASHDILVKAEPCTESKGGAWELVLKCIAATAADLLVMGAHEEIGFPFVACEVVHSESPIPVLTSA